MKNHTQRREDNMTERIWTRTQYGKLSELQKKYRIPEEVIADIHRVVDILDKYYDPDRDVDREDGGYVFLILPESEEELTLLYRSILRKYNLQIENAELKDIIYDDEILQWHSDLYLVSNDYSLNIVYYTKKG